MIRTTVAAIIFAACSLPALADGKCFTPPGKGVSGPVDLSRHYDGDTFYLGRDRIRLWGIDAPERDEYGYKEAAEHLRRIASGGGNVDCDVKYVEKRGARRCVAVCRKFGHRASFDLAFSILENGWAKVHRSYINEYPELKPGYEYAEAQARRLRRGIWR